MRVLCHAQNFKGIGHFVRMHAIARGLAEAHEVYLVDGGRAVPHHPGPWPLRFIEVPRLTRAEGAVVLSRASGVRRETTPGRRDRS